VTVAGDAHVSLGDWNYYARLGVGPWWARDEDHASTERGALVTMEIGTHDGRLDGGIEQKRLGGTRVGALPLMNVIARISY